MEVAQVLHMNGGDGETSYANNSLVQRGAITKTIPILKEAITGLYLGISPSPSTISIADLGCSSGSNTFFVVSELIMTIENLQKEQGHQEPHDYQVFLNDLPGNDFNALFTALGRSQLEKQGPYFFSGVPGSFYGRLFPKNSLHFVYSSYCLHWLSQVPEGVEENKGNISMESSSPRSVTNAYYCQFQNDFSTFLKHRSQELVSGGRMVLTMLSRSEDALSEECFGTWELLGIALNEMVSEGLVEEEKVHAFNVPLYRPFPSEVKAEVLREGSFSINHLEVSEVNWTGRHAIANKGERPTRAMAEPLLASHFGQGIMDDVFRRYTRLMEDRVAKKRTRLFNVTASLTRKPAA